MKTLTGGVTFLAVTVVCATLAGLALGGLTTMTALASVILGGVVGILSAQRVPSLPIGKWSVWDWVVAVIFTLVCLRAFIWVLYPAGDEWMVLSPNNLGDLSLHITFIRYMAAGTPFWPESPIFAGTPLVYPPGVDLLNSLLVLLSMDLRVGLILVGLSTSALTFLALRKWGGSFAVAALLFGGGVVGFQILQTGILIDYQAELIWKNAFLALFVTQRGLLYALPAGLLLLSGWRDEFLEGKKTLPHGIQWLIYATMPLFHVHSFLFLSVILAVIFVGVPRARMATITLVGLAFIPATLFVLLVTGGFSAASGIRWVPDWMVPTGNWVAPLKDLGVAPWLGLIALGLAARARNREGMVFLGTAALVFAICTVVAFSQWPWDNTKLMLWCWLVCAPYLFRFVIRPLQAPAQYAICVLLFFTGAVSLFAGLDSHHGYSIAKRSELAAWEVALRDIPKDATFAAIPTYNHPLLLLGQKLLCGYEGHLYSHGIKYQDRYQRLQMLMQRPPGWEKELQQLGATHAAFRANENPSGQLQIIDLRAAESVVPIPIPSNQ